MIDKLNGEISAAIGTTPVRTHFEATGAETVTTSTAVFGAYVRQEWETYGRLIGKLKLTPE